MSTITISNLPAAGALTGAEVLPIVQSGTTSQTTTQDIANLTVSASYAATASYAVSASYEINYETSSSYADFAVTASYALSSEGGGGLTGTSYVYVAANGTDIENAAALQAAYVEATSKVNITNEFAPLGFSDVTEISSGRYSLGLTNDPFPAGYLQLGVSYNMKVNGTSTTGTVTYYGFGFFSFQTSNPTLPGLTVTSVEVEGPIVQKATVVAAPGYYNFEATPFIMNQQYVNLVSLDGNRSIIFNSSNNSGSISVTVDGIYIKGVDTGNKTFTVADNLNLLTIENCNGGDNSFADISTGTFINCNGGNNSFGGNNTAAGTYVNCVGKDGSFGGYYSAVGKFTNCTGGTYSFGYSSSGTYTNCIGGYLAFAGNGTASGIYRNCVSGNESFGGGMGIGTASGTFINCEAGNNSFGGGTLNGKLYYCRLTEGTFKTVSGAGVTRLCIDGNNSENNQG